MATKKQEIARKRNFLLFRLKGLTELTYQLLICCSPQELKIVKQIDNNLKTLISNYKVNTSNLINKYDKQSKTKKEDKQSKTKSNKNCR